MIKKQPLHLFAFLLPIWMSGCALGPNFQPPEPPEGPAYSIKKTVESGSVRLSPQEKVSPQWWKVYRSEELNRQIDQALSRNPGLSSLKATLLAAQEDYAAQSGDILYPDVSAGLSSERRKLSGVTFGQSGGFLYTLHNASVTVLYNIDPFGSGRRYLESLRAKVDNQGYQFEAAYLSLAGNIVTTVINLAALQDQIHATKEILDSEKRQLEIVERQYHLGAVTLAEVLQQKTALSQTRAQLPALRKQLEQVRHQMAVLMGVPPEAEDIATLSLEDLHLPDAIPVSLPSELVHQRPDILAAEAQLHQATALVGMATANLYPSLSISAGYGRQAINFSDLLSGAASSVWNLGGSILQPLFNGGQLKAKRRQALADFDAARSHYQQTLLQAFQQVADVLSALQHDVETLRIRKQTEALSLKSVSLTESQFRLGASSYLNLLNAQQQFRSSRIAVIQARAALLADTAALFQALGGGMQQRDTAYRPIAGDASFTHTWKKTQTSENSHGQP
ncbi:MAG: efflux transporter outer membrane subunit [Gammaproteobacteria bacterium]|nr:MAG: efflux transporter outer membrane subunit [Gammaproteobacteria bacterium]